MKKFPETDLELAKESYDSLCLAHIYFREEYTDPTHEDKLELLSYAVPLAAKNRGIDEEASAKNAIDYVYDKLSHDMNPMLPGDAIHHSIRFLNMYLDAHVYFGFLAEEKVCQIMEVLDANYAIDIPA